jgi:uncharacterized membrane protein
VSDRRPQTRLAVAALALVALALRLPAATTQSLWVDEVETLEIAALPLRDLAAGLAAGSVQPTAWLSPLYYAALAAVLALPHQSAEWLPRLFSVLLGVAAIPALVWTARGFVARRVALTAGLLLAVSPFHVWYSLEVRPYALLILLAIVAVGAYGRALATNRTSWWAGAALATVLALHAHPVAVVLPLACGAALLAGTRHGDTRGRGVAALAAVALAFVPALLLMRAHGMNHPSDVRPDSALAPLYALYSFAVGFSLGPSTSELRGAAATVLPAHAGVVLSTAGVFGTLLLAGIVRAWRSPRRTLLLAWFALPMLLAAGGALATANPFNVRYAVVAQPAFVVLIAAGLWSLAEARAARGAQRRRPPRAAGVLAAAMLVLCGWSLANLYGDPRYAKEACRDLGVVLRTEAAPADLVLVNAPYMSAAVRHYYPGPAEVVGYPRDARTLDAETAALDLADLVAGRRHVWLVLTRTFHGDGAGMLRRILRRRFADVDREYRLPGIVAYRFSERGGPAGPPAARGEVDRG